MRNLCKAIDRVIERELRYAPVPQTVYRPQYPSIQPHFEQHFDHHSGHHGGNTASMTAKTMVGATARTMAIQPDHPSVIALKVVSNCDSRRQAGSSILMQSLGIQALGYQATQFHSVCLTHTSNTVFILAHGDPSNRPVLSTGCGLVELIRLSFRNC